MSETLRDEERVLPIHRMEETPVARPKVLHIVGSSKFGGDSLLVMELCHAAADRGY